MGQQEFEDELLFQQVSNNDVEGIIKSLRHDGAGLEWVDKEGRTPLILACTKAEFYDAAKSLLELGSNVDEYRSGSNAGTPLHHAANEGLDNTVKLLLSHGANPFVLNDDSQTPLEIARAKDYSNVVRAIENHICLFSGWMREFYGPSFLEFFAPQLLSRRVWVVIIPTAPRNPTKPFKLELLVYASLQDAQPRMVMPLWKANLEEPKSYESDASVIIIDNSKSPKRMRARRRRSFVSQGRRWVRVDMQIRLKLAAATEGDMQQLNWFCEACKGNPQPMNPLMFLQASQKITTTTASAPQSSQDAFNHHAFMANVESISKELMPSAPPSVDLSHVNMSLPSGTCVICEDASSEAVCVPCGHVAGCISCLKEIKDKKLGCPICRANIDQVIKLYHV